MTLSACTTREFRCENHLSFHASNEHSSSWHTQLRTPGTTDAVFHYIFKRNFPLMLQRGHLISHVFQFHECKLTSSLDSHYSQVDIQCSRMQNWEKTHSDIQNHQVLTQSATTHTSTDMFIYLNHAKLWIKLRSGCYITLSVNIRKGHKDSALTEFEQEKRVYLLGHNVSQSNSTNINSKKIPLFFLSVH